MQFTGGNSNDETGQALGKWFSEQTKTEINAPYSAIGFVKDNKLSGVAIFNDYTGSSVEIHIFTPNCFTREAIKFVYNYIFNDLKCNIFIAKPHRKNKKLLRILNKLNKNSFTAIIPRYYGPSKDEDAILHVFTREWASNWIKIDA